MNQVIFSQDILTGIIIIANKFNLSVNEFLEQINQEKLTVIDTEELEDLIDFRDAIIAESDPENQERISWDEVKKDLGL
jgi:hypothetical protein